MLRIFIAALLISASAHALDVTTNYGTLTSYTDNGVEAFKGIPYAAPPVGALRWKVPQEPAKWSGAKIAWAFGNQCPQASIASKSYLFGNEDCLYLNVFRPQQTFGKLPVMVFIHGGGNSLGSASNSIMGTDLYDGAELARHNVIVVTLNYRLGILGFLAHPALKDGNEGNYGLLDQIAALKYVRGNIEAFGGDPANVTVFGESAGAIDTLALMTSPLAKGLFHKAIVESGFLSEQPLAKAEQDGLAFAKAAGCETAECLRTLSAYDLIRASQRVSNSALAPASATIDGVVLTQPVLQAMQNGEAMNIPLIIGSNKDEMTTLLSGVVTLPLDFDEAKLHALLVSYYGEAKADAVDDEYPAKNYANATAKLQDILGDSLVHCPTRAISRALLRQNPNVYRYLFTHVSDNAYLKPYGAGHALELPYVFGNMSQLAYSQNEFILSQDIQSWWTAFARQGSPKVNQQVDWRPAQFDSYLQLDGAMMMNSHFKNDQCDFWDQP